MKRYDLRHLQNDFYDRMIELINGDLKAGEVGIFLFEIGDFSPIQKSADVIREQGHDLMNSLKFNEVDWTIVVKKVDAETKKAKLEATEAKVVAEKKAEEEAEAKSAAQKAVQELKEAKKAENTTETDETEAPIEKAPVEKPVARRRRPAAKPRGKAK